MRREGYGEGDRRPGRLGECRTGEGMVVERKGGELEGRGRVIVNSVAI